MNDVTIYSKEFNEKELIAFIHEAWKFYEDNKDLKIGMGIDEEKARYIVKSPNVARFFEGMCCKALALDPTLKYLTEEQMQGLIQQIANNIKIDGRFYKLCDKLPYEQKD